HPQGGKVGLEVKIKVDSFWERLEEYEEAFQGTKVFAMPNSPDAKEKAAVEMQPGQNVGAVLIPRIEGGNNLDVSIQEETVAELWPVESEAASYLDQISRYYITWTKLVSKIAKYPHVEDCHCTVTEMDEKEYISLRLIISELRNQYVTQHIMTLKNIEKIK
uniref:Proteasome activator PA28 C-terminal domain-containing protein n=1 Tax=Anolis carolinensis TaxID=28377 RepID=A0A803T3V5_ANOCA